MNYAKYYCNPINILRIYTIYYITLIFMLIDIMLQQNTFYVAAIIYYLVLSSVCFTTYVCTKKMLGVNIFKTCLDWYISNKWGSQQYFSLGQQPLWLQSCRLTSLQAGRGAFTLIVLVFSSKTFWLCVFLLYRQGV